MPQLCRHLSPRAQAFLRSAWGWRLSISAVALLAVGIAASISLVCPHVPRVHDEFSYILSAETLLKGRLANPTPEVWQPLQSFHVIMQPAYASKYPLGNGLLIAAGWLMFGLPIAGSWLAAAICAASVTWMLAGAVPRRWALFGGCLVALHPAMQTTWSQSLLSGWLTAAGSALVLGAVLRLRRRFAPKSAIILGVGIGLLALTRPFEGLVCTLICAGLLWQLWRSRSPRAKALAALRIGCWSAAPIAAALALTAAQNWATTGSPLRMPYQVHEQTYGVAPLFVFEDVKQPNLTATELPRTIHDYHHGWSLDCYRLRAGLAGWLSGIAQAFRLVWDYWGIVFCLLPLALLWTQRARIDRLLLPAIVSQIMASSLVCWISPHYLSPIFPCLALLAIVGLQHVWHRLRRLGMADARIVFPAILACQLLWLVLAASQLPNHPARRWSLRRAELVAQLHRLGGKHLVLVHYSHQHSVHEEWVYNSADPVESPIIWARGERPEWNAALLDQFQSVRRVWEVYPDRVETIGLIPYKPPEAIAARGPTLKTEPPAAHMRIRPVNRSGRSPSEEQPQGAPDGSAVSP